MSAKVSKATAVEVRKALRERYPAPEWAFFEEVGSATGAMHRRSADALAMNLYPSRGLGVLGFEIKVSRIDWGRELANPDKAEPIARYCDQWWIVAPKGVVLEHELPKSWGLLELSDAGLRRKVDAEKMEARPLDRPFVAAICRAAHESAVRAAAAAPAAAEIQAKWTAGFEAGIESQKQRVAYEVKNLREMSENVQRFQERTGIDLRWEMPEEFKAALSIYKRLAGHRHVVGKLHQALGDALELLGPEETQ